MSRVCVVTTRSRAYYSLVSRLRRAGLPFASMMPDSDCRSCEVVLTTAEEAGQFGERGLALEDLDENPGVFKGQIYSRLTGGDKAVFVGVDPGKRIGLAVYYGETELASTTFESVGALCGRIGAFAARVPARRFVVRIGNGNTALASKLAEMVGREVPEAVVEIVDESGTSARSAAMRGMQRDEVAAAKIAFRRGEAVARSFPRSRGRGRQDPRA